MKDEVDLGNEVEVKGGGFRICAYPRVPQIDSEFDIAIREEPASTDAP
jgi:hypothetical protein